MTKNYMVIGLFAVCLAIGFYIFKIAYFDKNKSSFMIREFNYEQDHQAVDDLFHKDDNWYWMICTQNTDTYPLDFVLKYKTSSSPLKKYDMIMHVATIDGKIAGFCSYFPKVTGSNKVWQLLFLIVDQDFRRQGVAKKLLAYAVEDMARRGAIRIDIATRNNNFKAQNLYKNFGAKLINSDDGDFAHFAWYKPTT